jgi:hypothetical protein
MTKTRYPGVMIGCPISNNRGWIALHYLQHLYAIDYPKKKMDMAFLYNYPSDADKGSVDDTRCILENFRDDFGSEYRSFQIREATTNYEDSRTPGRNFTLFTEIRNRWLEMRNSKDDYIFSIDSDILLPLTQNQSSNTTTQGQPSSNILRRLIDWDKPIVSALIYNGLTQGTTGDQAFNFMVKTTEKHADGSYRYLHRPAAVLENDAVWKRDGEPPYIWRLTDLPRVDMTGAAMLIRKDVLDSGVVFGYHVQGEDIYFCEQAISKGFGVYLDFTQNLNHFMNPGQLNQYLGLPSGMSVVKPGMGELKPDKDPVIRFKE